jgi:RNA polymerase sigma factor (sigma-70 family)
LLNYDPKRGNFTSYAYKTTYEKLKVYAIKNSGPLSINQSTFNRLLETGMIKDFEKPISIEESPLIETLKTNGDDAIARIESIENRNLARFIKKVASCTLTPRQEFILRKKLGLDGEDQCTFKEIAEQEGVSRTSVKRHFKKAMKKLTCEINLHSIARKRIVLKVKNKKK